MKKDTTPSITVSLSEWNDPRLDGLRNLFKQILEQIQPDYAEKLFRDVVREGKITITLTFQKKSKGASG